MAFMSSMNVVGSALTAEMLRLDVISENITEHQHHPYRGGGPYRRKVVVLEEQGERTPFQLALARAGSAAAPAQAGGVRVVEIAEDPSDFKLVYDPDPPGCKCGGVCGDAQRGFDQRDVGRYGGQSGAVGQHYCV